MAAASQGKGSSEGCHREPCHRFGRRQGQLETPWTTHHVAAVLRLLKKQPCSIRSRETFNVTRNRADELASRLVDC